MIRILILLFFASVITASCQKNNINQEMRSPGERAFRANCQTCHRLPKATMKTDEQWPVIVNKYGDKAKLSESQKAAIVAYLTSRN